MTEDEIETDNINNRKRKGSGDIIPKLVNNKRGNLEKDHQCLNITG